MKFSRSFLLVIFHIFVLAGCSAVNLQEFSLETPAQILTYPAAPPISDQRPRFRELFCGLINENSEAQKRQLKCEDYLWRLDDEKQDGNLSQPLPVHDGSLRIILVTGAFAECFPKMGKPYQNAAARLERFGYRIDTLVVSGRSGSDYNAAMLAKTVKKLELKAAEHLVLLGYSKGATDILHFLVDYPEIANKVTAVVSVAGVINGTPLADKFAEIYANWFKNISFEKCEPGDGGVLASLRRSVQFSWMAAHPLPRNVRYYSIATFARREDIQPGLLFTYDFLRKIDPRNDGQVIFYDQLIPGSSVLAYVNLDHWAVAVPVREETASSAWAAASKHPQVRALLFEAMVLFLVEQLRLSD